MKQLNYSQIIKLAKTAIEEDSNWGMEEIIRDLNKDKTVSNNKQVRRTEIVDKQKKSVRINVQNNNKNIKDVLDSLKQEVLSCKKCPLGKSRINAVFGIGDPYTNLMFIGGPWFSGRS